MKYFVITMPNDKGKERLNILKLKLKDFGIEDYSIINGGTYGIKFGITVSPSQDILENNIAIMKYCLHNNIEECVIIEDDCHFVNVEKSRNYFNEILKYKPIDYNIILSCVYSNNLILKEHNEYLNVIKSIYSGHIFAMYSKKAMQKIIEYYKTHNHNMNFDTNMHNIFKENIFVAKKYFAIQTDGYSLKDKRDVNHNKTFEMYKKVI